MTTNEVRELLKEAQIAITRVNSPRELPADRMILSNVLKVFAGEAMKLAARAQMRSEPLVVIEKAAQTAGFKVEYKKAASR